MTGLTEAVARAICASDFDGDTAVYDEMSAEQRANFTRNATAALAAIEAAGFRLTKRPPPKNWEVCGWHANGDRGRNWVPVTDERAKRVPNYRKRPAAEFAMVAAAKETRG